MKLVLLCLAGALVGGVQAATPVANTCASSNVVDAKCRQVQVFQSGSTLGTARVSPDGRFVASALITLNKVVVWEVSTGFTIHTALTFFPMHVAWAEGRLAITNGLGELTLLDSTTWATIATSNFGAGITELTMSPDGVSVLVGSPTSLAVWQFDAAGTQVQAAQISAGGTVASGFSFSPDGALLFGHIDTGVHFWRTSDWTQQGGVPGVVLPRRVQLSRFLSSGQRVAMVVSGDIMVADVASGEIVHDFKRGAAATFTSDFSVSPGDEYFATTIANPLGGNVVDIISAATGKTVSQVVHPNSQLVKSVHFSPVAVGGGGLILASGGLTGEVILWNLPADEQLLALQAFKAALYDPSASPILSTWVGTDYCAWQGVQCVAGRVETLVLHGEQTLNAAVPNIQGLRHLLRLYVAGTGVTGFVSLPAVLREVDFSNTNIQGPIPAEVLALPALHTLRAINAGLTGPVVFPPNVWQVDLQLNQLTGPLPTFPASLHTLIAYGNQLDGPLPPSPTVVRLVLNHNQLVGGIPAYPNLMVGRFHSNKLSGPFNAAAVPRATVLELQHNEFSGSLPDFGSTNLVIFKAHFNKFTGPFPLAQPGQRVMHEVVVSTNMLTGPEPTEEQKNAVATKVLSHDNAWD
eukprot:TRINITY_DN19500_c0_g1_i1.p1 TRINITY_DN19500_c0_g1~~TRINITY_DN19500_c0_g1_i1.p1  ORF type:complete len:653 (+),score=254.24 TRINITY_DN19500_c0_g1_i1:55-1959(+)